MRLSRPSALAVLALTIGSVREASAIRVTAQRGNICSAVWETGQARATPNLNLRALPGFVWVA